MTVPGKRHRAARTAVALLGLAWLGALAAERAPDAPGAVLRVGRLELHHCETPAPWCASLPRALDPSGAVPGTVPVYFEYYPHTAAGPAAGTLVATEGGPGFPATESREEYLALFAPLRADHDVLIMDNRGTGRSGAIDCVALQNAAELSEAHVAQCGRTLGRRAQLYSTNLAADDLAELLEALGIGRVSLYGDSYGTYFSQVFALRHPRRLRALVLDGAYPLEGPDYAWYPHYAVAMRAKFNRVCERSSACRALPGNSLEHITPVLQLLREAPLAAHVRLGEGRTIDFVAGPAQLAILMFGAAPAYTSLRETDAAARAFVAGDRAPLLRLMAETSSGVDSRDATHAPRLFSAGLAAAVSCQDPPQVFDMNLPVPARLAERERLLAARRSQSPDLYAPFTIDEYRGMPLDYSFIDECARWPAPPKGAAALPLVHPPEDYPDLPVLVVSGELDNMTSVADGAAAAARFPGAHHVVIANGLHVNALPHARSECGASLVQRFLADLTTGDEGCAAAAAPVRPVGRFVRRVEDGEPADVLAGNEADERQLRAVSVALLTAEDAITRARDNGPGGGTGLRGGRFTVQRVGEGYELELHEVRWSEDLEVSGRVQWPGRSGTIHATLTLEGGAPLRGTLEAQWPEGVSAARARIAGTLGEHRVLAEQAAP